MTDTPDIRAEAWTIGSEELATLRRGLFLGGGALLAVCLVGVSAGSEHFYPAYLLAYLFWVGVALGCLPLLLLHHLTGGAWGLVIRRILEAATRTLPFMAVLFLPILVGIQDLYTWARPELVANDPVLQHKSLYLNVPFFLSRVLVYFLVWIALAQIFSRFSAEQDQTGDAKLSRRMELLGGPGLVAYGLTVTFAGIDWVMSLDPHWFSHIFGALWGVGQVLAALTFAIAVLVLLAHREPFRSQVPRTALHDLGKLLLTFVMLWAYFSFSQYLIIWSANTLEGIPWYLERMKGGWQWIGLALILGHFVLPFLLLLSRNLKRDTRWLAGVAIFVLLMRTVDIFWAVAPNFQEEHVALRWMDVLAFLGLGGVWLGLFLSQLQSRPLLPLNDPYMEETLVDGGH